MASSQVDYYELLEVDPQASTEVIRKAYRVLAARHHPDGGADTSDAETMRLVNDAYKTLMDPRLRAIYDRRRTTGLAVVFYEEGLWGLTKRLLRHEGVRF